MAKLQHEFEEYLDDEGHIVIKINPLDYIMSRIWDSGKIQHKYGASQTPFIYFDDLKDVLNDILCFDNLEGEEKE